MSDYSTLATLAIAEHSAALALAQAERDWMDRRAGYGNVREVRAAYDAAALALHTALESYRTAAFATLTTEMTGALNDLVFTALIDGAGGEDITITLVDPAGETAAESVTVTGTDIVVTLRSVSATLSTAVQVKAALDADPNVAHLLTTALVDAGSGEVTALTKTALALA